jgi:hypothetical protein
MKPNVNDPAVFYEADEGKLEGLNATYVDDSIAAGTLEFLAQMKMTEQTFQSKPRQYDNFRYNGLLINTMKERFTCTMDECRVETTTFRR